MKSFLILIISILIIGGGLYWYYIKSPYSKGVQRALFGKEESMTIRSDAFSDGQTIPAKYTCEGQDVNPPFTFSGIPIDTKSLAIIVEDKDSTPKNFTHWIIFNIKAVKSGIDENMVPEDSVEGINDFETTYYAGPCPQTDTHKYVYRLYALDSMLGLKKGATKKEVFNAMENHVLEEAQLSGLYKKVNP